MIKTPVREDAEAETFLGTIIVDRDNQPIASVKREHAPQVIAALNQHASVVPEELVRDIRDFLRVFNGHPGILTDYQEDRRRSIISRLDGKGGG